MVMDVHLLDVRPAHSCPGNLGTHIGILAARLDLLSTMSGESIIITGAYGQTMVRSLLPGDPHTVALGAVQLGRALRAAGIDWSVWSVRDLDSGRVEAELREVAGDLPAGQSGWAAR